MATLEKPSNYDLTSGSFATEGDAEIALDRILANHPELFRVYKEVPGWYLQPRAKCETTRCRIDRLVVPTQVLVDAGWKHGPFGIECKASGKKVGKVVMQCQDYSRAVWELDNGFQIVLDWIFIWPLDAMVGSISSVMAQSRIGYANHHEWTGLRLGTAATNMLKISPSGKLTHVGNVDSGRKSGSR